MEPEALEKIDALMREGLDHYAMGDDARAIECWQQVLRIDPEHAEAQDYLRTAADDDGEQAVGGAESSAETPQSSLLEAAVEALRAGEAQEALELLESLEREDPSNLAVQGTLELTRTVLLDHYRGRLCDGIAVPQRAVGDDEVMKFNLPADAGFVLAGIDGSTSVNDLVDGSGLDPFLVLRTCCRLIDAGIIEVHP